MRAQRSGRDVSEMAAVLAMCATRGRRVSLPDLSKFIRGVTAVAILCFTTLGAFGDDEHLDDPLDCIKLKFTFEIYVDRWQHYWALVFDNSCTYPVESVFVLQPEGQNPTKYVETMGPGRTISDHELSDDEYYGIRYEVVNACRMFLAGGEYYGLDPNDTSKCLHPEIEEIGHSDISTTYDNTDRTLVPDVGDETFSESVECIELEWFEFDMQDTISKWYVDLKNECTYGVQTITHVSLDEENKIRESFNVSVPPRQNRRLNYSWYPHEAYAEADVFNECRMHFKDGEIYGIDPDDYSQCLVPDVGNESFDDSGECVELEWIEFDASDTVSKWYVDLKNECAYRVQTVVEVVLGEEKQVRETFNVAVGPRHSRRLNYSWYPDEAPADADVYNECRMFDKGGENHGIDPDDYSRCLAPDDVETTPSNAADKDE